MSRSGMKTTRSYSNSRTPEPSALDGSFFGVGMGWWLRKKSPTKSTIPIFGYSPAEEQAFWPEVARCTPASNTRLAPRPPLERRLKKTNADVSSDGR